MSSTPAGTSRATVPEKVAGHSSEDFLGPFETDSPSPTWEDGAITGSGRVGALVFGPAGVQTVSLSHELFFLPANPTPPAPLIAPELQEIRRAVLDGDGSRAGDLMMRGAAASGYGDGLIWTNPLGICATLVVRTEAGDDAPVRRSIDLEHGEIAVEWEHPEGGRVRLRAVAPRDGETVCLALESERAITATVDLGLSHEAAASAVTGAPDYSGVVQSSLVPGAVGRVVASAGGEDAAISATTDVESGGEWTLHESGAHLTTVVQVPAGGRALVTATVAVASRSATTATPTPTTSANAAGAPATATGADWEDLRAGQAASHGELLRRSVLTLGADRSSMTTDEIWRGARRGDAALRRRVAEIAYLSGRANAISSTGLLPPTLQGVWQGTWTPAWSADYTMNGNVQNGGMAGLIPTGTPELARSLLRLVLPHLEDYRANARNIFGAEGMLLPARMSDSGSANHFVPSYPHIFWVGCGGWVLRFAADLVSTTGDRTIVDDELWALVTGVLEFAETATVVSDGVRHLVPGYSPENAPIPDGSPITSDPTMDVAILRDAARCARLLADARGDHGLDDRWDRVVAGLPPYRVASDGSLAEWIDEAWPENHAHRHASQLYPLWYEPDPAFLGDTEAARSLRQAAATTIARKIAWRAEDPTAPPGRMEMAFGLVQLGLAAAALGDAESALTCAEWLAVKHWRPALTTTHDAGRIFNLDASGGFPALVAAMLVASDLQSVTLFPALPDAWGARGSITGLAARGGIVVDRLSWDEDGAVALLRRRPDAGWLRPEKLVRLRARSSFRFTGGSEEETLLEVGAEPVVVHLVRRPDAD
ncbi:glycosyl hydrolase family 95 catalytic domain-containing protein [Planctomonas deserti]|uniref:glycosyl hydrolase family 95 catalytic domain-containing protein n=1 Tax=Planctomonas deserti TaxID=2144185 RepID=UPI000D36265F|nr:glycoside hydrolase N-terminal domain-containing protein [Planctomonas deserti]